MKKWAIFTIFMTTLAVVGFAQEGEKSSTSKITGFSIGISANGSAQVVDDSDEAESGSGFGLVASYGFANKLVAYLNADVANLDTGIDSDVLSHVDLGVKYVLRNDNHAFRPSLGLALTGIANVFELLDTEFEFSGSGLSFDFGAQYFVSKNFALDASLVLGFLEYNSLEVDGESIGDLEALPVTTSRVKIGVRYTF